MDRRPSNILMVSTSYPSNLSDWRGLFIRHLADALSRKGDFHLNLWAPPGNIHPNASWVTTSREAAWLSNLMKSGGIAHLFRSGGLLSAAKPIELLGILGRMYRRLSPHIDIYHINWLQNSLPLPSDGKPVLITVLGTDLKLLSLPLMRTFIRRICKERRVAICPNADWMVPLLRKAFGNCAIIQEVPFGIDPDWYAIEREKNTPTETNWIVVSRLTRNKIGPLFEWCAPYFTKGNRHLHLFGPMQEKLHVPDWVHYHGPASPIELLEKWFPKAQGLVTLSRHAEGRPQVMLEAMASGLPIIASRLPAHENILSNRQTGWLCNTPVGFGEAIEKMENINHNKQIGDAARKWVRDEIGTWDDCAKRYHNIYEKMLQ